MKGTHCLVAFTFISDYEAITDLLTADISMGVKQILPM